MSHHEKGFSGLLSPGAPRLAVLSATLASKKCFLPLPEDDWFPSFDKTSLVQTPLFVTSVAVASPRLRQL
jgi:hypothetical protein